MKKITFLNNNLRLKDIPQETKMSTQIQLLNKVPKTIIDIALPDYLPAQSIANLSSCSSMFYRETKKISYWKEKLKHILFRSEVLHKLISAKVIHNYKNLYHTLLYYHYKETEALTLWELCCLSGEVGAIEYAIKYEGLNRNTKGIRNRNMLHTVALSGSVDAIKFAISLGVDPASVDDRGTNVMHFAALSGSMEALKYASTLLPIKPDLSGFSIIHAAALSGSVETLKYVIEKLEVPFTTLDSYGGNILHYAAQCGSIKMLEYVLSLGFKINSYDNKGNDVLLYAASSGSVKMMEYVFSILKRPPQKCNIRGINPLHNAARSGSIECMKYAIDTLKIPIDNTDQLGGNVLHYAAWGGSVKAMKFALSLGISPRVPENNGMTLLHNTVLSGSVEALLFILQLNDDLDLKLEPFTMDNLGHDAFWYAQYAVNNIEIENILRMTKEERNKVYHKNKDQEDESKIESKVLTK